MKLRRLMVLLTALVIGFSATACNTTGPSSKTEDDVVTNGGSIEMWSRGNGTDKHAESLMEAFDNYQEETNIEVKYQFIPHSDVVTKWNAAFASSTAPDVMDVGIVHIIERINLNHIVPVNDYVDSWEGKSDIFPAMLELGSLNDNIYAIAHLPDPQIFAYRKDLFEEVGLDPEQPPKDWDQLLEYAEKLTTYDDAGNIDRTGMTVATSGARFLANILVRQNGTHFADEDNNVPIMNNEGAIETVEFMNDLHKFSSVYDNSVSDSNPLLLGNGAMGYIGSGAIANYLNTNPDMQDKFGFIACVPGQEEATWCGVWFYSMTSQADDPDMAWDLISYLTSSDVLNRRVEVAGLPSAYQSTSEQYVALNPLINQAVVDGIAIGAGNPKVSWAINYEIELDSALEEVFYGVATAEEALTKAQENLMKELN